MRIIVVIDSNSSDECKVCLNATYRGIAVMSTFVRHASVTTPITVASDCSVRLFRLGRSDLDSRNHYGRRYVGCARKSMWYVGYTRIVENVCTAF